MVGKSTAETDLARTKALYDSGAVAPAVYDQMKARYDGAKAAVRFLAGRSGTDVPRRGAQGPVLR